MCEGNLITHLHFMAVFFASVRKEENEEKERQKPKK